MRGRPVATLALALVLLAATLAGCIGSDDDVADPSALTPASLPDDATALLARAPDGSTVRAQDRSILELEGACPATPCDPIELGVSLSAEDAELVERMFVTVSWDGTETSGFDLTSAGADDDRRGHGADRLTFEAPLEPVQRLELEGSADYTLRARLVFSDGDHGRQLPNLVTTTPGDFSIPGGLEPGGGGPQALLEAVEYENGCLHDERIQSGAERCLRFGNAPGNVGQGPLEVRLETEEGVNALTGEGQYIQRVRMSDGTWEEQPVAGGVFHTSHAHFHYVGFSDYRLYAYDLDTGLRGEQVGDSNKVGFCPIDHGAIEDSEVEADPATYRGLDCYATTDAEWVMGISKGRYDLYGPDLVGQYVEISGVPDGVYQLVSTVDVDDTIEEEDEHDNAASVVLRLEGDDVEVLETFSFYQVVGEMAEGS